MGADRTTLGRNCAPKVPKNTIAMQACAVRRTIPSRNRAAKRIQKPAKCLVAVAATPPAITRLRNTGLQSAHTQFPAIWTKSEGGKDRPHCEHHMTGWTAASWLITYPRLKAQGSRQILFMNDSRI